MNMFQIKNTRDVEMYIAPTAVSRIVARDHDGGGCVIYLQDGTRIETYTYAADVYGAMREACSDG